MAKIYSTSVGFGPIGIKIKDLPQKDRELLKIEALVNCGIGNTFIHRGYTVTVIDSPKNNNGLLEISIQASKNGLFIPVNNPLLFKNPPIMIPDGTWHKESKNRGGRIIDEDTQNFIENPLEALKEIIIQIVELNEGGKL